MPQSVLSLARVNALLARPLTSERLEELLFDSKAEFESLEGDRLTLTVTPDRLDLLSEGGLALHFQGILGEAKGIPPPHLAREEGTPPEIHVDPHVAPLRPVIAGLLIRPPEGGTDTGTLEEAIRFQEIIHVTVGRDRRRASLGIYAANRLKFPIRYSFEPVANVRFEPLGGEGEVSANEFFRDHAMALRYGSLGHTGDRTLVLRDARGEVLSLPPVLNGNGAGAARAGDGPLLLESTGTLSRPVREALGLLWLVFAARGYQVSPVTVVQKNERTDGRSVITPHRVALPSHLLSSLLGTGLSASEVEHCAARARLSAHPVPGGWDVEAPAWRPDLLGPVDAAEDLLFARGLSGIDPIVPPSATRGRRLPTTVFRRRMGEVLLGAGFTPLFTTVLVSHAAVERVGRIAEAVKLVNPPSAEYGFLRSALQVSLVESLRRNTRHGYPQALSEVGPVVQPSASEETGARTSYHAGFVIARDRTGFADAAARVDYLLRTVDVLGIRESATLPGTIAGRAARLKVAGETVAEVGEIHPSVLEAVKVPVAVAWGEVDLSALWPLLGSPKTV
jgi:phenylalanyl-tRNA synthetase beta chain